MIRRSTPGWSGRAGRVQVRVMAGDSGASLNAETCDQDGTCAVSDGIRYIDATGTSTGQSCLRRSRSSTPPRASSPGEPRPGTEVELRAQATSPVGAELTYRW